MTLEKYMILQLEMIFTTLTIAKNSSKHPTVSQSLPG